MNVSTTTGLVKSLQENSLALKLEAMLPCSFEFRTKQCEEHNIKVDQLSQQIYDKYLPQGKRIAEERRNLYCQRNYKCVGNF